MVNRSDMFLTGSTLIEVGECERRLGAAEREFLQTSAISFLTPLRNFLEGDWRTISVSLMHQFEIRDSMCILLYNRNFTIKLLSLYATYNNTQLYKWMSK